MAEKTIVFISRIALVLTVLAVILQFNGIMKPSIIWVKILNSALLTFVSLAVLQGLRYHAYYELNPRVRPVKMIEKGDDWNDFLKRNRFKILFPFIVMFFAMLRFIWSF